jgi:hypothetical protein
MKVAISIVLAVVFTLAADSFAQTSSTGPILQLTPDEIDLYKNAGTLLDWNTQQVKECSVLQKLQPATNQDQLPKILERVREIEAAFLRDFPQVTCLEDFQSDQWRFSYHYAVRRKYQYVVIPHPEDVVPTFEEYRTTLKGAPLDEKERRHVPMITSNFVSVPLLFSTADQPETRYRYFGTQNLKDRQYQVVGFAQDPERAHRLGNYQSPTKRGCLLLQGVGFIDAQTSQITSVVTWLLAPRPDLGLFAQVSTVNFDAVTPDQSNQQLWLPHDVTVVVKCQGFPVKNTHHYSNFKLFRVESSIKP